MKPEKYTISQSTCESGTKLRESYLKSGTNIANLPYINLNNANLETNTFRDKQILFLEDAATTNSAANMCIPFDLINVFTYDLLHFNLKTITYFSCQKSGNVIFLFGTLLNT